MQIALARLMRLYYSVPLAAGLLVIVMYVSGGQPAALGPGQVIAVASLACLLAGTYILNDMCDLPCDRINCPSRPLVRGEVSLKTALLLSTLLYVAAMALAGFSGGRFLLLMALLAAWLICYNVFAKRLGVFKNVMVAVAVVWLYLLGYAVAEPVDTVRLNVLWVHPAWLFLTTLGYQMLKDVRDIAGDRVTYGGIASKWREQDWFELTAKWLILGGSFLTLVPAILGWCKGIYAVAAVMAAVLGLVALRSSIRVAIRCVYAEVALVTLGSYLDLVILGV